MLRLALRPLGALWSGIAALRVTLHESGPLPVHRLPRPAISVGALEMGGTGKSPATAAVARVLSRAGLAVGILSRGYGRRSRAPLLVSDGSRPLATPLMAGDEPTLYARTLPGVAVAVGDRREEAAALLLAARDVDVFVLDDAFQHVRVHRELDLLLVDSERPFWDQAPPPGGSLREGAGAARRADAFLITGDRASWCAAELARRYPGRPTHRLRAEEPGAVPLGAAGSGLEELPQPALPFAGIARPERLVASLERAGVRCLPLARFPDHHWFRPAELERLRERARAAGARCLVTTQKDAARLAADHADPSIWIWRYDLAPADPAALLALVRERLTRRGRP